MKLYESIKKVAKSKGCSITKMEKDLDLGKSVTSKFDEHTPSIEKIVKIADYFDVSVDTLIGRPERAQSMDEYRLTEYFKRLNAEGQYAALSYVSYLLDQPIYKKSDNIKAV